MSKKNIIIISSIVAVIVVIVIFFGSLTLFHPPISLFRYHSPISLFLYNGFIAFIGGASVFFLSLIYLPLISSQWRNAKKFHELSEDLSGEEKRKLLRSSFIEKHKKKLLLIIILELVLLGVAAYLLYSKHEMGKSIIEIVDLIIVATGTWLSRKLIKELKEKHSALFKKDK